MSGADDPTAIRSLAVTAQDVVAAKEVALQAGREAVLRVTPPFSGRMRARLHVSEVIPDAAAAGDADHGGVGPSPVEIPPGDLLADLPPYPHPDETEDDLRADPDAEYTRERHRAHHRRALEEWREQAGRCIVDAVVIETPSGPHEVEIAVLGAD